MRYMKKILLILALLLLPLSAFAALELNLTYPPLPGGLELKDTTSLTGLVAWFYTFFVMISGLAAFVMIVWGGVQWMTSQGNPTSTGDAKDKIQKALLGLLLVLSSFIILQIINPELTLLRMSELTPVKESERCIASQIGMGIAPYRCAPAMGMRVGSFECTGNLPIVNQGASKCPGEQCVKTTQSGTGTDNCLQKCIDAGGETALTGGIPYCCNVPSPGGSCKTSSDEIFTFAQTPLPSPLMWSVMRNIPGAYGCDGDWCKKTWRQFTEDTARICNDDITDSSPINTSLCKNIESLWVHGEFVVVLYENENFAGERICLEGRKEQLGVTWKPGGYLIRLDEYKITPDEGWGKDADSIKILQNGNPDINELCEDSFN